MALNGEMALPGISFCVILPNLVVSWAHCVKEVVIRTYESADNGC